jgi:hypothetical protein
MYMDIVPPKRHYAIDWLQLFEMFRVYLFHCARLFDRVYGHGRAVRS